MLVLTRKKDERVCIQVPDGPAIWVTLISAGPGRAKLGFDAPEEYRVDREEVKTLREAETSQIVQLGTVQLTSPNLLESEDCPAKT